MIHNMSETWVPASTFGSRLAEARRVCGLTVEDAAARCGIKHATWSMWEREESSPRNMAEAVEKIEMALGVDRNYLMWGLSPEDRPRLSREHVDAGQERFSGSDADLLVAAQEPRRISAA